MGTKERRAIEKQLRLNQILDAARLLLFSDGIDNISISKIAQKAELGVGTIYFYFKSKEDIFIALQEEGLKLFYDMICPVRDSKTLSCNEKLKNIGELFYRFNLEHKEYCDILNFFLSSSKEFFEPDLKNKIDMSGSKIFDLIEYVILEGIQNGELIKSDTRKCAIFFFGALHGVMQLKKLEKTALAGENHRDVFNFTVDRLIRGITT
jgi:AcrR family transcriptional regulator